jgi:uncharacterized membrane protein HdeD (DUF308 family)
LEHVALNSPEQPKSHSDTYLFLCANTWFHLWVVALWSLIWFVYSYTSGEWHWFMRSGAVTVVIGALVSFRNVIRLTQEERVRFRNMSVIEIFTESEKRNQEGDSAAVLIGVWVMIAGTAVAAYGDLLGGFLKSTCAV